MTTSAASSSSERTQRSPLASQRAGEAGGPARFPLGYKDGFSQWWANISPVAAENTVLSFIPYLRRPPSHTQTGSCPASTSNLALSVQDGNTPTTSPMTANSVTDLYGPRTWHSSLIRLSGRDRALNEFSVERDGEPVEENLVMLHGYGAGLGFFYKNFEGLSRNKGWKLYALDLLGMGRSSRPTFRVHAKDQEGKIREAENWFIDALEEWRVQKNIDRFTLMGHSLGGYMAVAYALKYPGHLKKLILASPVGIPEDPYAVNAEMPDPESSTLANEFTQDQDDIVKTSNPKIPESVKVGDNNNFLNARSQAEKDLANGKAGSGTNVPRRPLPKWLTYLWDANISPFSLVRWTGPLGPRFVSGWTSRRFSHLPPGEAQALHDYSYSLFRQRGSGEYALAYVLAPGAFARDPLIRRIHGVGRQAILTPQPDDLPLQNGISSARENGIPIVLMYGENDWMDIAGGYAAERKIKDEKERILKSASEEERKWDNGDASVVIIKNAGHHVYLDGWEEFNRVMSEEMREVVRREKLRSARLGVEGTRK